MAERTGCCGAVRRVVDGLLLLGGQQLHGRAAQHLTRDQHLLLRLHAAGKTKEKGTHRHATKTMSDGPRDGRARGGVALACCFGD